MIATAFSWLVFLSAALVAVVASVLMVTRRNPVHSALWLIVTFFSLGILYLSLNAQFIAVAQVIVYAGAIMMLILFVIMLIHLEKEPEQAKKVSGAKIIGSFITIILFLEIIAAVLAFQVTGRKGTFTPEVLARVGDVKAVGTALYGKYLFPFEIASILLLIGIVGAVVLSKRRKD
ncbi:MAG: dehydrogenase [Deltaproteobacteria bacterium]|jgi:NADH-quinone oxidoreductase subunit J|nr:dehydrogenase [Deltaproteobacteria bacterium]